MERYKNLSGTSGVAAYEIGQGSLTVQFKDGSVYLYTDQSAGAGNIQRMQQLAAAGSGLNSFIGRVVRKAYAPIIVSRCATRARGVAVRCRCSGPSWVAPSHLTRLQAWRIA